jgi:hypothetical protein
MAPALAAAAGLCLCGCDTVREATLTGHLWDGNNYVVPATQPQLTLAQTPQGILAQYNSASERNGQVHRRAYLLEANYQRVASGKQPVFVDPAKIQPQTPIPVFWEMPKNQSLPELCAVCQTNFDSFVLYRAGQRRETYDLPVFKDRRKAAEKAALTPLAATGDAAIAATIIGAIGAVFWAICHVQGGWPSN